MIYTDAREVDFHSIDLPEYTPIYCTRRGQEPFTMAIGEDIDKLQAMGFDVEKPWSDLKRSRQVQDANAEPLPTYTQLVNASIKLHGGDLRKVPW